MNSIIHAYSDPIYNHNSQTNMSVEGRVKQIVAVLVVAVVFAPPAAVSGELVVGFYKNTCPKAEALVQQAVSRAYLTNPGIAPGIIRLLYHDCFVEVRTYIRSQSIHNMMTVSGKILIEDLINYQGCDASVLLDVSADGSALVEKDANISQSLRGFEAIDFAKASVEEECPGVVSCSDILNFAARDSVELTGGITWDVPAGRRDTRISIKDNIRGNFPGILSYKGGVELNGLLKSFTKKGLTPEDMAVLSGAHSLGRSHCLAFIDRLYEDHYSPDSPPLTDPTMSEAYAHLLRRICRPGFLDNNTTTFLDMITPNTLDNKFYLGLLNNLGLLMTDQALTQRRNLMAVVKKSASNETWWRKEFASAMVKMGKIEVLEGTLGEIRTNCRFPNGLHTIQRNQIDDSNLQIS